MKTGIIDVGGGLRGIYAAGVFDFCLDEGITFDFGIGISAGSANLASFLAKQRGRNFLFYQEYSLRKQYMGFENFIFHHSFIDLDYVYGTLSNLGGENLLDYPSLAANPMEWYMPATNARTGKSRYFGADDITQDDYSVLKASCAIPFVCPPQIIDGIPYYDGGLGDPVPVRKAFESGCDRVILLLTKPVDQIQVPGSDATLSRLIHRKYPNAARALMLRSRHYNKEVQLARRLSAQGRVLIISPDDTCGVDTLTRDKEALGHLYHKGYRDGRQIYDFLSGTVSAAG